MNVQLNLTEKLFLVNLSPKFKIPFAITGISAMLAQASFIELVQQKRIEIVDNKIRILSLEVTKTSYLDKLLEEIHNRSDIVDINTWILKLYATTDVNLIQEVLISLKTKKIISEFNIKKRSVALLNEKIVFTIIESIRANILEDGIPELDTYLLALILNQTSGTFYKFETLSNYFSKYEKKRLKQRLQELYSIVEKEYSLQAILAGFYSIQNSKFIKAKSWLRIGDPATLTTNQGYFGWYNTISDIFLIALFALMIQTNNVYNISNTENFFFGRFGNILFIIAYLFIINMLIFPISVKIKNYNLQKVLISIGYILLILTTLITAGFYGFYEGCSDNSKTKEELITCLNLDR
jgi:hypothetical protein